MAHRKGFVIIVLAQMHFIQRKQFNDRNVTSHNFKQISRLKTSPECFHGPLKMLWPATCVRRPLIAHRCPK